MGEDWHKVRSSLLSRETTSLFMSYDRRHCDAAKYPQIAFVTPQQHHRRIETVPERQYLWLILLPQGRSNFTINQTCRCWRQAIHHHSQQCRHFQSPSADYTKSQGKPCSLSIKVIHILTFSL